MRGLFLHVFSNLNNPTLQLNHKILLLFGNKNNLPSCHTFLKIEPVSFVINIEQWLWHVTIPTSLFLLISSKQRTSAPRTASQSA